MISADAQTNRQTNRRGKRKAILVPAVRALHALRLVKIVHVPSMKTSHTELNLYAHSLSVLTGKALRSSTLSLGGESQIRSHGPYDGGWTPPCCMSSVKPEGEREGGREGGSEGVREGEKLGDIAVCTVSENLISKLQYSIRDLLSKNQLSESCFTI